MTLETLHNLARELAEARASVERKEEELAEAKKRFRALAESAIPEAMEELGLEAGTKLRTPFGELVFAEVVRARINKSDEEEAFAWLQSNDEGDLIKTKLELEFGRGEADTACRLRAELERSLDRPVSNKQTVHHSTLSAWARNRLEEGLEVPSSIQIHLQKSVTIK